MKPYITFFVLFLVSIIQAQENGFDNPEFQEKFNASKAKVNLEKELGNDWNIGGLDLNFGLTEILLPEYNPNLFRDQCGNWYLKETFYTTWKSRTLSNSIPEHNDFTIRTDLLNPCWPPMNYKETEYRLDLEQKLEWYREVNVTFKIVEL